MRWPLHGSLATEPAADLTTGLGNGFGDDLASLAALPSIERRASSPTLHPSSANVNDERNRTMVP